jgi:hypothetical protein
MLDGLQFTLEEHPVDAACHVCGLPTTEAIRIVFPTRSRGAAAIARTYRQEPDLDDLERLQPTLMPVYFACHEACVAAFWPLIGEEPPDGPTEQPRRR